MDAVRRFISMIARTGIISGAGKVVSGGGGDPGGGSLLLDTYSGSAAAYSLRRLSSSFTGSAIRVRRSSDNTESDINFDSSGNLDESALLAFCGSGSGFVSKWYDQSGNARDTVQASVVNQPRIVNLGVVDKLNGKAALRFISSNSTFLTGGNILSAGSNPLLTFAVGELANQQTIYGKTVYDGAPSRYALYAEGNTTYSVIHNQSAAPVAGVNTIYTGQRLFNQSYVGSGNFLFVNNTQVASNTSSTAIIGNRTTRFLIGAYSNSNDSGTQLHNNGHIQEVIIYLSAPSRSDINTNINTYYTIY
jgi:hypothetical protein